MNKNQNNDFDNIDEITEFVEKSQQELDTIDYVIPTSKKHKKSHHHKSDSMTAQEKEAEAQDFVFATPHKKKHKKNKPLKIIGIVLSVIAAILIVCVSTLFIFNQAGKKAMHNYEEMTIEPSPEIADVINLIDDKGKTIEYKGKTYSFNEDVATIVFMGIDTKDFENPDRLVGEGGQADAIYIAVIDTKYDKVSILGVSRDSMVDVNIYNTDGEFVNTENMQICLSYAYGDAAHTSCENTLLSLERLFYGLQFDTYFSIDTRSLETLTDAVSGVTLTTLVDYYSKYYGRTIYAGETVTIHGIDAEMYVRSRDIEELTSNNDRMARQRQFMKAFLSQIWPSVKKDPSVILDLYNGIKSNSTTNLTTSKMTYLTTTAISSLDSYKEIEFVNIPGAIKKGEYAEFHINEEGLMEVMLNLFYTEVE